MLKPPFKETCRDKHGSELEKVLLHGEGRHSPWTKISKKVIMVDPTKVEVISKLPLPTIVKRD